MADACHVVAGGINVAWEEVKEKGKTL